MLCENQQVCNELCVESSENLVPKQRVAFCLVQGMVRATAMMMVLKPGDLGEVVVPVAQNFLKQLKRNYRPWSRKGKQSRCSTSGFFVKII